MSAQPALQQRFGVRARYRLSIASRALAAVVGGYVLTSLLNLALPLLLAALGSDLPQAALGTMLTSFLVYAAIIMAAFHARSATRVWVLLIGAAVPLALIAWLLLPGAPV